MTQTNKDDGWTRLKRDGKVAVVWSPGYGAGWYTWNTEYGERFCLDSEIAQAAIDGKKELASEIAERIFPNCYTGGARDLRVDWVDEGALFRITEYGGSESVEVIGELEGFIA